MACALREGTLTPFIEAGITREWLTDQEDTLRAAVFRQSEDMNAWMTLVRYWEQHGKVPSVDMFRRSYPADAYKLPDSAYTADELTSIFREDRRQYLTRLAYEDITDAYGEGKWDDALELMAGTSRIIRETNASQGIELLWDSKDYDVEARIDRKITRGIRTGIPGLDNQPGFYGFQPGNLICYLGRAKAAKTVVRPAVRAHRVEDGKRVLFVSFEIAAGRTPRRAGHRRPAGLLRRGRRPDPLHDGRADRRGAAEDQGVPGYL